MGWKCNFKLCARCKYLFRYGHRCSLSVLLPAFISSLSLNLSAIYLLICSPWLVFSNRYSRCPHRKRDCSGVLLAKGRRGLDNKLVIMTKIAILFHALCRVWQCWNILERYEHREQRLKHEFSEMSSVRIPQGLLTDLNKQTPLNMMSRCTVKIELV